MQDRYARYLHAIERTKIFLSKQEVTRDLVEEYFKFVDTLPVTLQILCMKECKWTRNKHHYDSAVAHQKDLFTKIAIGCREFLTTTYLEFQKKHYSEAATTTYPDYSEEYMLPYYLFSED